MFSTLVAPTVPDDGIVAMMQDVAADARPHKVDLTVGLYKNSRGETPLMKAARAAELQLAQNRANKAYVLPAGDAEFMQQMKEFSFGSEHGSRFIEGVQTPGASGALGLILELLKLSNPKAKIWVSDPTYINHIPTIKSVGLAYGIYPFLDSENMDFREDAFFSWMADLGTEDVVIFHGCCHNPSGLRTDPVTWGKIAEAAEKQGFFPLFDTAYQGLGDGVEEDAEGLAIVMSRVDRLALSISCSKSFSLYSDRVGCAFVVGKTQREVDVAQTYLSDFSRPTYWVPPNNGAQVVANILSTPELKSLWLEELGEIRCRVQSLRNSLVASLREHYGNSRFDYIADNSGMFSMLPATKEQMQQLRKEFAIYGLNDGRINIAALKEDKIDYVAASISKTL